MASLPLLLETKPKLIGIARLAAEGTSLREAHEVEYFTLPVRSLLNRCTGVRMPFTWTINPYRGCEFACKYCYARYTHEFMELRDGVDFEQKIFVKQHAANLLRQELRRVKITTMNTDLARILEPRAPRPDLRMDAVRKLMAEGVRAGVLCAPVLPGITDSPRDLEKLVRATAQADGAYISANSLFLKPCSAAVFLPFLEKEFPQLVENYRKRYQDRAFVSASFSKSLSQLMTRLRSKYNVRNGSERYDVRVQSAHTVDDGQMKLF